MKNFLLILALITSFYAVYFDFIIDDRQAIYLGFSLIFIGAINFKYQIFNSFFKNGIFPVFLGYFIFYSVHFNFAYKTFDLDVLNMRTMILEILGLCAILIMFILTLGQKNGNSLSFFLYTFLWVSFILEMFMHFFDYNAIVNKNYYAYHSFLLIGITHLRYLARRRFFLIVAGALFLITFFAFHSRTTSVAIIIYLLLYYNFKTICKTRLRIIMFTTMYFIILGITIYYYVFIAINSDYFNNFNSWGEKGVFGRLPLWIELMNYIGAKPLWGYGSNISSEFIYSVEIGRNLSAHNTYLNLLFRNGILGFAIIFLLWFKIILYFQKNRQSKSARVGISFLFASLWMASAYEMIYSTIMSFNLFYWIILAFLEKHIENEKRNIKISI
jgi:O-antigen ligase